MAYLTEEEWETFQVLFQKKEGTNYHDTREVALGLVPFEIQGTLRLKKDLTITELLVLAHRFKGIRAYERNEGEG